jgi:F-type H+-transporting ATPase subunit epsilon
VAVERKIWSGEARMVIARTTEGELGILPGHAPLLGQLAEGGVVTIRGAEGEDLVVAAHGGFVSVTERGVSILAETAEISTEIDVQRARDALSRAEAERDDPEAVAAARRAQSRLRAAGQDL